MFDENQTELLEIAPVVDIVSPEEEVRPPTPPPEIKQEEIFSLPTSMVSKYGLDKIKPKKGVGKRGKDKKPRVKKPPTMRQLAHLAKMRKAAAEKRTAAAFAKRQKLEEAKKIVEERDKKKVTYEGANIKLAVNKKIHRHTNNPRAPNYQEFFTLMDKYEEYKTAKIEKKKEATLQERLIAKRANNPHPNKRIPMLRRPAPPVHGMYSDIFNYKGS